MRDNINIKYSLNFPNKREKKRDCIVWVWIYEGQDNLDISGIEQFKKALNRGDLSLEKLLFFPESNIPSSQILESFRKTGFNLKKMKDSKEDYITSLQEIISSISLRTPMFILLTAKDLDYISNIERIFGPDLYLILQDNFDVPFFLQPYPRISQSRIFIYNKLHGKTGDKYQGTIFIDDSIRKRITKNKTVYISYAEMGIFQKIRCNKDSFLNSDNDIESYSDGYYTVNFSIQPRKLAQIYQLNKIQSIPESIQLKDFIIENDIQILENTFIPNNYLMSDLLVNTINDAKQHILKIFSNPTLKLSYYRDYELPSFNRFVLFIIAKEARKVALTLKKQLDREWWIPHLTKTLVPLSIDLMLEGEKNYGV